MMEKGFLLNNSASEPSNSTIGNAYVDMDALNARMQRLEGINAEKSDVTQPRKALRVVRNPSLDEPNLNTTMNDTSEIQSGTNAKNPIDGKAGLVQRFILICLIALRNQRMYIQFIKRSRYGYG